MSASGPFVDLAIALGLGLLVGLQRERQSRAAGLRTFTLVTFSGALAGLLVPAAGGWVVGAGLLAVAAVAAVNHYAENQRGEQSGLTTEMALVAMFLVGAYLMVGDSRIAVVLGGGIAVLLNAKARFKSVMERLGDDDVRAVMQFALLSLVILPILPNRDFGPWHVFNLFEIWLLVVLIVGINLIGYIAYKFIRPETGALLSGLLGGIISSTATTVSYARRTRRQEDAAPLAAVVIMISTAVVLVRVLIEVGVVAPGLLATVAIPLSIVLALSAALSLAAWWNVRKAPAILPERDNPTMLRAALVFGGMYAFVLFGVAWVQNRMGNSALYVAATVAGLTDVDAITLSTAKLAAAGGVDAGRAWRVILTAYLSNLAFKALIVAFIGSRRLLKRVAILFTIL
ncbi:MAG: MgtC/SapB family protein, partial [Thermoanaerobaculia bacterium]